MQKLVSHLQAALRSGPIGADELMEFLEQRGVVFDDYDLPDLKTVDHVCVMGAEKAAWFKDPDGNVLCLHQGD